MFSTKFLSLVGASFLLTACAYGVVDKHYDLPDAGDASLLLEPQVRLVCEQNTCGTIVDKYTGITADCGECSGYTQCGGNNRPNNCNADCLPNVNADGTNDTNACNLYFNGPAWGTRYGTQVQYDYACNYANPLNCEVGYNQQPADGICSADICRTVWCCVSNPDAGTYPLLSNNIASSDGGM